MPHLSATLTLPLVAASFANAATPFIDSIAPPSIATGLGPAQVTISGGNFAPGASVAFGARLVQPDAVTAAGITFTLPASALVNPLSVPVTVTNPATPGANGRSNPVYFQIASPAATVSTTISEQLAQPGSPAAIAAADLNGDGKLDLAVVSSGSINIYPGDGAGHSIVGQVVPLPPNTDANSVTVGDFNNDGIPDIVAGCGNGILDVLLGDGVGNFLATPFITAAPMIASVAAGDFNGDGNLDIVLTRYAESPSIEVLLGNGAGQFTSAWSYTMPGSSTVITLRPGDFNGDGILDLAVSVAPDNGSNAPGALWFLQGSGEGEFTRTTTFSLPFIPETIAADFNNDGNLDLYLGSGVTFLGRGSTSLSPSFNTVSATSAIGSGPQSGSVAADFNGDGFADLVFSGGSGPVVVDLGNGDGTFAPPQSLTASGSVHVIAGDFNGDGLLDLASASAQPGGLEIDLQSPRPLPGPARYTVTDLCPGQSCSFSVLGYTGVAAGSGIAYYPGTGIVNISRQTGLPFFPTSINRQGYIAGNDAVNAAVYLPPPLPALLVIPQATTATFINDKFQIAGAGVPVAPGLVPGQTPGSIDAILDNGTVLGAGPGIEGPFIYAPGVGLTHLMSNANIFSFFFNDAGEILLLTPYPGELFTPGTGITSQPTPAVLSAHFNTLGQFVGYTDPQTPFGSPNFLSIFTATGGEVPLSSFLPAGSGYTLEPPDDINDRGQILVGATRADGSATSLLLTPVLPGGAPASPALVVPAVTQTPASARYRAGCEDVHEALTINGADVCPALRPVPERN